MLIIYISFGGNCSLLVYETLNVVKADKETGSYIPKTGKHGICDDHRQYEFYIDWLQGWIL